jgi:dimethylglycine dehydrogenase
MSYAGELGWELHCSRQQLPRVYEALWQAGQSRGLSNYGSFAMNAMRLEKMFKGASELTNEVTLAEADVMRFVKLDKTDFTGKAATEASVSGDLPWICAYLEVDDDGMNDGHGGEAVLAGGECIGTVSSIAYGFGVEKLLAFAYLKPQYAIQGTRVDVVIMGQSRAATVQTEAAYDPDNLRPRT